jgi:hypothetical protein
MVRAHAVWALRQIAGAGAPGLLAAARANETDLAVMAEYDGAGRPSGAAES